MESGPLLASFRTWLIGGVFPALVVVGVFPAGSANMPASPGHPQVKESRGLSRMITDLTPPGWKMSGKVKQFTASNLYELINGGADLYVSYDVVEATHAFYVNTADNRMYVDLYVYDMGSPTNAFGIFSVERSSVEKPLDLGRAGYRSYGSCFIWQGRYYIRIVGSDSTDEAGRITLDMARKLIGFVTDSGEPVWGMTALPGADRVPHSVKYFRIDAMGLDFMKNTYTARYRKSYGEITAFLSQSETPESAKATLERYAQHAEKYGRGTSRVIRDVTEFLLCNMGNEFDVVFHSGRLVGGITMVSDRALAIRAAVDFRRLLHGQ